MAEHDILLDSTLDSVEIAEDAVLKNAEEIGFREEELHQIGMAVRETMVNAVVHGNRYNARKKVHLSVLKGTDRLTVVIADEGEGFDMNSLPNPLAAEKLLRQSGRGLLLIQAFVDEFQVRRGQPGGTEVRMVKYLAKAS
jgi:serine/threonine-protein kinase RsbW